MEHVEKNNKMPLYLQLADILRTEIVNGVLKENEKLLTEMELGEKYKVSRITVRKALEIFRRRRTVDKKAGTWYFCYGEETC